MERDRLIGVYIRIYTYTSTYVYKSLEWAGLGLLGINRYLDLTVWPLFCALVFGLVWCRVSGCAGASVLYKKDEGAQGAATDNLGKLTAPQSLLVGGGIQASVSRQSVSQKTRSASPRHTQTRTTPTHPPFFTNSARATPRRICSSSVRCAFAMKARCSRVRKKS